jgi:hypothetical protein
MGSMCIKTSVLACSVSGNNCVSGLTCASNKILCNLNCCKEQQTTLIIDKDEKCTGMEQNAAARKLNPTGILEDFNNNNHSITRSLLHKQSIKIYHQNIKSLRYKMNELLCHLSYDIPHILV